VIDDIEYLSILADHHIKHQVLVHDAFSWTQKWGSIHTFYVKILGSQSIAYSAAALLGKMLEQDAIGIYHPITEDEEDSANFHQYFTIYSDGVVSNEMILQIIKEVCEHFPDLSGQLDISGQLIEFHDFYSTFKGTNKHIEEILNENFPETFRVETQLSKSTVL